MKNMKGFLFPILSGANSMTLIRRIIMPLLLITAAACTQEQEIVLADFRDVDVSYISPVDSVNLEGYGIFMPEYIIKHQDKYVIKKFDKENLIDVLDKNTGEILKIAKKGRALNEYISIGSLQYVNGYLYVYDVSLQKYNTYSIDSLLINGGEPLKVNQYQYKETPLGYMEKPFKIYRNNNNFITIGLWENDSWYRLMTKDGRFSAGVERVTFEGLESMTEIEKATLHLSSCISIKPSGDKVVCALCNAPAISVSNILKDKLVEKKRIVYDSPKVDQVNQKGMPLLQYDGSNLKSFCNIYASDSLIYALYSGRRMDSKVPSYQCNHLLIYDWELKPIKRYELNNSINSFCIEGDTLYGVSSYPEGRLYVYRLDS